MGIVFGTVIYWRYRCFSILSALIGMGIGITHRGRQGVIIRKTEIIKPVIF